VLVTATAGRGGLALATHGLRKAYGSHRALDGLDLAVPSGVVYGFLGPNGAGKTTTMRLLTGLLHPDAGSIEILGTPLRQGDRRRLFEVGALIEAPAFYPYLSARGNLRELAASGAPTRAGRFDELLELVGLRERADDAVGEYSLGMKQRLGIAAALLSDPSLLLLDEPANGLDPAGIAAMRDTLRLLASQGKTVFVSSHQLAEVQLMADVVGIIAAGRLVREGPLKELLEAQGLTKVRVRPEQVEPAIRALAPLGAVERLAEVDRAEGWLAVRAGSVHTDLVNQTLVEAGIYASGLEAGNDLETLFLELTGDSREDADGRFVGLGGISGSPQPAVPEVAA
jgi:ABC-2 type transport system ATP-binding protein